MATRDYAEVVLSAISLIAAVVLAKCNLRVGRGDLRGAGRIAVLTMAIRMVQWALLAEHTADVAAETLLVMLASVRVIAEGMLAWLFYVALEPYVRRFWPQTLMSWSRVLSGRLYDPLVGRDILVGALVGVFFAIMVRMDLWFVHGFDLAGRPRLFRGDMFLGLLGGRQAFASLLDMFCEAIFDGLFMLMLVMLVRAVVKRNWATIVVTLLVMSPLYLPLGSHPAVSWFTIGVCCLGVAIWLLTRFGIFVVAVAIFSTGVLIRFPLTADLRLWFSDLSLLAVGTVIALAVYGFFAVRKPQTDV